MNYTDDELDERIAYLEGRIAELRTYSPLWMSMEGFEAMGITADYEASALEMELEELERIKRNRRHY